MVILDVPPPAAPRALHRPSDQLAPDQLASNQHATEPLGIAGLRVRPLDPATDGPRLVGMCPRVSAQSRYQRFFSGIGRLSDSLLALLLDVDHERREALVALEGDEIVAVARYSSVGDAQEADVSLLVVDDLQRHGIASALLTRLEALALEHGVSTLTATVLGENRQARGLLSATHPQARGRFVGGSYSYRYELGIPAARSSAEP